MSTLQQEAMETFSQWYAEARQLPVEETDAVALATCDAEGNPTVRIVLMRVVDAEGFLFFTNSRSRKGEQLAANPRAALCFYWDALGRQVRVEGTVEKATETESDDYWNQRRRGSQIASTVSQQSSPLPSRETYLRQVTALEKQLEGQPIARPAHWHGYRIRPQRIEFWTNGEFRMHERWVYEQLDGDWSKRLLYP